jgi:hypothetical protein
MKLVHVDCGKPTHHFESKSSENAVLKLSFEAGADRQRDRGTQTTFRSIAEHDVSAVATIAARTSARPRPAPPVSRLRDVSSR